MKDVRLVLGEIDGMMVVIAGAERGGMAYYEFWVNWAGEWAIVYVYDHGQMGCLQARGRAANTYPGTAELWSALSGPPLP